MNNEPLELARRFLSGGERNSRSGRKARAWFFVMES